jgi:hypothetical protein
MPLVFRYPDRDTCRGCPPVALALVAMMVRVQYGGRLPGADLAQVIQHCAAAEVNQQALAVIHYGIDIAGILKAVQVLG